MLMQLASDITVEVSRIRLMAASHWLKNYKLVYFIRNFYLKQREWSASFAFNISGHS